MNQREKIMVYGGLAVVLAVIGWKLLFTGAAGAADASSIDGAIARIGLGERLRASVDMLAREMALAIPTTAPSEQESAIREDLARKAQESGLLTISLKGIESTQRGASRSVLQVQYRLELYGSFDGFMKLVGTLERAPVPYVVKEISFENSPRPPAGVGEQGGGSGGEQTLPNGQALSSLPPEMREKAERMMRSRGGDGKGTQPNGKVHVTLRVQSFLFPADSVGAATAANGAAKPAPMPTAVHQGGKNPAPPQGAENKGGDDRQNNAGQDGAKREEAKHDDGKSGKQTPEQSGPEAPAKGEAHEAAEPHAAPERQPIKQ